MTAHSFLMRRVLCCIAVFALLGGLPACSVLRTDFVKSPSTAVAPVVDSALTREMQVRVAKHAGQSGFRPLLGGTNALLSRLVLADSARHSIDLQYYIFANDQTGRLLAQRVLAAADRGVRVRILLDDFDIAAEDHLLDALDVHPNIEVRLFNPLRFRQRSLPSKLGQFLLEAQRLNRRMHNKSFIVDGTAAIIGGRNIGDAYFDTGDDPHFRDLDVLAIGPVVPRIAAMFDRYWNDKVAYPVQAYSGTDATAQDLARVRDRLAREARAYTPDDYAKGSAVVNTADDPADSGRPNDWYWGDAKLVVDAPAKVDPDKDEQQQARIERPIQQLLESAQQQILVVSPYFIPGDEVEAVLEAAAKRGVTIEALTNSLAANDEPEVHAGYAHYRRPLLMAGAQLFEFRPLAANDAPSAYGRSSGVSLHAKAMVIDHHQVFIGSMNFDPRSRDLNTEMGVIVDSPALATAIERFFASAAAPENSFHVMLDPDSKRSPRNAPLRWAAVNDGKPVVFDSEPECSLIKRLRVDVMRLLPLESLL
ncbi:MAG: phospholipase D family protein [Dokdonella sp.]